ncbi:unnamed protein product [Coffea canephora]|uniref:NB-ARC domain-containing protein n=1 Tax=Coffea canephora TaxID=49390 RepID=A0A068UU78_COFCA|nr:unnamed protein product [Coffea canephora]
MKNQDMFLEARISLLLELVKDCQVKTKHLMEEIKDHLPSEEECSKFQLTPLLLPLSPDDAFWTSFVDSVVMRLESVETGRGLSKDIGLIRDYVVGVCSSCFDIDVLAAGEGGDHNDNEDEDLIIIIESMFEDFLNHVGSVIVRTAFHSCYYWFHCKKSATTTADSASSASAEDVELSRLFLDLRHQLDPANPKYLELHLDFLKALYVMKSVDACRADYVACFCNYFFFSSRGGDISKEVSSLLVLFFNSKLLEDEGDDHDAAVVQSFFAQINAVLLETAYLLKSPGNDEGGREPNYYPASSEPNLLLIKVCLLRAELYFKVQLQNINSGTTVSGMLSAGEQLVADQLEILENLRKFSKDLPDEEFEYGEQATALFQEVADEVASLYVPFDNKITESMFKNSILQFLLKIVIFKAESFLMELLSSFENSSGPAENFMPYIGKGHVESLLEQLNCFKLIFSSKQMMEIESANMILAPIEAFLREVTSLSYSNLPREIVEDTIKKTMLSYSELLGKLKKHLRPKLNEIGHEFPLSKFPKTHRLGFVDFLLRNLRELLKYCPQSIAPVKHNIQEIQQHLTSLSSFLMKVSVLDIDEHPELRDFVDHVTGIAYKVEYVIDSIVVGAQWQQFLWFSHLLEELRLASKQTSVIDLTPDDTVNNVTQISLDVTSSNVTSRDATAAIDEMLVDLNDEEELIINRLTRGSSHRAVICIFGMPGIGKTTMARKVYNNQKVMYHFHRRAWCTVSQLYEKRDLLLQILRDIHGFIKEFHYMSNEDLESKLRQCLLKNRYLIVMDDVWDAAAWDNFRNSCPNDANGSRILITSRLHDVALEIEPNCNPHSLRPFSDNESWNLLQGKVFQGEDCPEELLLVGKEIAHKCGGLPLAVVAISGLLQRMEKSKELWEKIAEGLSSEVMKDPEARCVEIIELSYKHLPDYLKACLLYLGVFLEDRDIPVSKLLRFWLAEGFIEMTEWKNLEDVAEAYLVDLINRSLVMITKRRSNGKAKACRLHYLIRDFCNSKSKGDSFFQLVTRKPVTYEAYRLSIFLKRNHFVESRPCGLGTRSLIFFASTDAEPRCPYDISFVCQNFKFLRVLDFECINIGVSFPGEIGLLVLLRYLAVSGYLNYIPQSIANLTKLETFVVKGFRGKVVLPYTVWHMTRLRHLHVNVHVAFDLDDEELGGCFQLENLISFSCPSLSCGKDTAVKALKKLPNLRKLRCIFFESRESSKNCDQFPRLDCLTNLESLRVSYYGTPLTTSMFCLPLNLKELTLSYFRLPWDHISVIGRLPNLEVLKLLSGAFEGKRWEMREEEFRELKFLKLDALNIAEWEACCDHLPKLERLVLQNCKDLMQIPYDFESITTLEVIEVHWCGESAEESAKEIGEATGDIKEEEDVFLPVPPCSEEDVRLPVPPCSELLIEICLLETELFLKKLLRHESLSSSTLSLISAQKSQTKHEFSQILQNLRRDHQDLLDEKLEHGKKAFAVIEQVIDQVASLCQSFEAKKISESMLKNSIRRMLLKIVIFRADSFLTESLPFMSNYAETFVADGKDQIALLLEQLIFLKPIKNVMDREEMDISFVQIESLLREITSLSYLNLANKRDAKEMIKKINLSSVLLLDKLKHRKRMLIEIGPQFPLFEFPKTHKLGFIDFLYTNLGELLKYDPVSIAPLKHYVEEIQQHLKSLSSFLVSVSESDMHENPELKDVGDRATEIAYKVEYVIDSIVDEAQWQHFFWFHHQLEELRLINELATGIRLTYSDAKVPKSIVSRVAIDMVSQERAREVIKEMVVNLSDEEQVIIDQLTRGSSRRGIVSIVGMPGLGKTTLARKVYNNQNVTRRFHCRAWCYVSQVYEKKELLLKILHDMHGLSDEICQMTTEDLESKLRQCLLKNKYLIVMDDVWDARAWNDLQNSFPDDNIGSRILMTSRHCHVALEIEPNGDPHLLRSLFEDESWILLEGKVFQGEGCPQELLPIGKKIAQRCGGLPLATVTISGLLQRTEKSKEFWENILESLSSEIMSDPEARCNEIFELSYKHLPGHLRACFLYLGVFLEERDIPVSKLIRFWLAEGFIPNTESRRLEDIAEAYLVDLINRSLVIVSKRRSNGQVKSCRLHDLILVFCRSKAKSENFLQLLMKSDEPYSSFPSSDYGFEFDFHDHLAPVTYKAYRLSIFLKRNHFVESRPSGPGTRSLIFFASTDAEPRCPYDISFICHNFKFLRVLDFESINIGVSFPVEIGLLVRLRYLAVSGYLQYIPKSIANLRKLETLIVKGLRGKVVLPKTIWHMTSLMHLHVNIHVAFKLDDEELGGWYQLENLSSSNCNQFPRLSSLTHLESLNIFYYGRPINTTEFILPSNLRKLTLSNFHLPWNRISAIGKLPKLEVLKLLSGAFEGPIWDMGDEEFQELKFLKLDSLNVAQWNASCDHLPKLERLVLQNCKELEKIPHDFAEISMLEMIEIVNILWIPSLQSSTHLQVLLWRTELTLLAEKAGCIAPVTTCSTRMTMVILGRI